MTKNDFVSKVKVGSVVTDGIDTFVCTSIINGFMYSFSNVDTNASTPIMSLIGITDGSVKDISLKEDK